MVVDVMLIAAVFGVEGPRALIAFIFPSYAGATGGVVLEMAIVAHVVQTKSLIGEVEVASVALKRG